MEAVHRLLNYIGNRIACVRSSSQYSPAHKVSGAFKAINLTLVRFSSVGLICLALPGCTLVDSTLPLRGTEINESSGSLRENTTLLNIVRASRFEPMNFTNLSSYNGTGSLEADGQDTHNSGVDYKIVKLGANLAATGAVGSSVRDALVPAFKVNTANNFNLTPLENKAFYAGFLAQLGPDSINLLVKAGLGRELVYHSLVDSVRVEIFDKAFLINNDPANDSWDKDNSENGHLRCRSFFSGLRTRILSNSNPLANLASVHLPNPGDCVYQKFLILMDAALEFGLTTESRIVPTETVETAELTNSPSKPADPKQAGEATDAKEAKEAKEPTDEKETVAAGTTASPRANAGVPSKTTITKTMQTTFHFCYDKAIASGYGHGKTFAPECGATSAQSSGSYHILPIVRSPYAVFQYYGRLLETGTANRVVLIDANTARLPTHDSLIFNVAKGEDAGGCFASAHHEGDTYCVPNTGSNNTKEIFILLNTLVNLSTSRDALPTTTTVQLSN